MTSQSSRYHMYGSAIGTLSVVLKTGSMGDVVIWSQTYGLGDVWYPASLDIIVDETFQVGFNMEN